MGLKERLRRIENELKTKKGFKVYLCYQDEVKDIFSISELKFKGTVSEGRKLMERLEKESKKELLFVITDFPRPDELAL